MDVKECLNKAQLIWPGQVEAAVDMCKSMVGACLAFCLWIMEHQWKHLTSQNIDMNLQSLHKEHERNAVMWDRILNLAKAQHHVSTPTVTLNLQYVIWSSSSSVQFPWFMDQTLSISLSSDIKHCSVDTWRITFRVEYVNWWGRWLLQTFSGLTVK